MQNQLNEYQQKSREFAKYPATLGSNIWYPALGAIDEFGELEEAVNGYKHRFSGLTKSEEISKDVLKEAGDVFWYLAQICTESGLEFQEVISDRIAARKPIPELAGVVKKIYRDRGGIPDNNDLLKIGRCVTGLFFETEHILHSFGFNVWQALEVNLEKLQDRSNRGVLHGSGDDR